MVAHMSAHHSADKHSNGSRRPQSRAGAHGQNTPGSSLPQQVRGTPGSAHTRAARPTTADREREKPPSKDGAAQRAAQDVAGLKDYVRTSYSCFVLRWRQSPGRNGIKHCKNSCL